MCANKVTRMSNYTCTEVLVVNSKLMSHSKIHPISHDCNHGNVMSGF